VAAAQARQDSVSFRDTAGRLHTKHNLMQELQKLHRVDRKQLPGAPHEVLLFWMRPRDERPQPGARVSQGSPLTGLVVTKLDGTSPKGDGRRDSEGTRLAHQIRGAGGGRADDLQPFDPKQFAEALFKE